MLRSTANLASRQVCRYAWAMPKPLQSTTDAVREHAHVVSVSQRRRRELKRTTRDITHSVQHSPAMPGDTTHNGADARKGRTQRDKLARHTTDVAYVLSDTRIINDGRVLAIERSSGRCIVRDAYGNIDDAATLAVASRYAQWRAANRKGQNA